jgi:GNAT superfamily N-acetyltransferase
LLGVVDIVIRRAGDDDVAAIAALRREWTEEQDEPREDAGFEARFTDWYQTESSRRVTWVAEADGALVGMVNLVVFSRMPRPGHQPSQWGYVGNAFVLAPYRNRGVGTRLLNALLEYTTNHRFARVVVSPSDRSIPFYRRAGFGAADMLMAMVIGD